MPSAATGDPLRSALTPAIDGADLSARTSVSAGAVRRTVADRPDASEPADAASVVRERDARSPD